MAKQDVRNVGHYRVLAAQKVGDSPYYSVRIRDMNQPEMKPFYKSSKESVYAKAMDFAVGWCQGELAKEGAAGSQTNFATEFQRYISPHTNSNTIRNYKKVLASMEKFHALSIGDITFQSLESYFKGRVEQGYRKSTLQNEFSLIRGFFNYCVEADLLIKNPCKILIRKRWLKMNPTEMEESTKKNIINIEQAKSLLALSKLVRPERGFKGTKDYLFRSIYLPLLTGLRRGNAFKMKWSHIDIVNWTFKFSAAEMKNKREFIAPMSLEMIDFIKSIMDERHPDNYIISGCKEKLTGVRKNFTKIVKELGLGNVRYHDLRHSYGRILSTTGIPDAVADALMSHYKSNITSLYGNLYNNIEAIRPWLDKLPRIFGATNNLLK